MDASLPPGWLDELRELLAIPSVSADPAHARDVARAAEWVAERVRALGGAAELREDGRLVVGEIAGPPAAPTVLVYGHYDVQPPAPLELWESDPFSAEVRGEWLYARGVADDKGQLWMQLKAIEELLAEGPPPVTFRIVCDGEEETGGDAILRFLESDDGPVDACVVLDGWMKTRNTPEFVVATRGLVALDVEVRTGERDLHSGHYGGTALNAIHALAQALTALFPRDGRLPEPLRAGVTAPTADEVAGWRDLPPGAEELEARGRSAARRARRGGVLRARLRRAVGGRHGDPRRQAGDAEHDAGLARVGGHHDPRRAGPGSRGSRDRGGGAAARRRSRPARRSRSSRET